MSFQIKRKYPWIGLCDEDAFKDAGITRERKGSKCYHSIDSSRDCWIGLSQLTNAEQGSRSTWGCTNQAAH